VLKRVLPLMSQQRIPTIPQNYAVWYDYVTKKNDALAAEVETLIERGEGFDPDDCKTIYEKYFVPPHTGHHEHTPLTIHHADANSDIKHLRATYPLIIIDIFNNDQLPNFMGNATFYQRYKSYLTDDGVIIFNLSAPDKDAILQQILLIRQQFHKHTLFVPVKHSHNLIMLAFKHPPNDKNDQWLQEAMAEAARQHMDLGCTFEALKALNISNGQQQLALFSNQ